MTVALVALALTLACVTVTAIGIVAYLAREARNEGRLAIAAAKDGLEMRAARDQLAADLARLMIESNNEARQIAQLGEQLSIERRKVTDARLLAVVDAGPGNVGAAVDRVLAEEAAARAAASDHRGPSPSPVQSGTAPAEPTPSWVRP